jgi:P-type Ca2+ transporter type 2C
MAAAQAASEFGVGAAEGLTQAEARRRLGAAGPNRVQEEEREWIGTIFLEEIREPMILLLLGTAILYSVWGQLTDALTIFAVILALVGAEVVNEYRATRAITSLKKLAEPLTWVRRDRSEREVPVDAVVPGDVVMITAGHLVAADARLVEGYGLAVDESSLTGESVPVDKDADAALATETPLADRSNLVYAGTTAVRGRAVAIAVATGMRTELGRIAGLTRQVEEPPTPLQRDMRQLAGFLVWFALGLSVLVPGLGLLLSRQPVRQMVLTGLSLAFALIPEELPIIITMVLGLGAYRLARRHAIAKRLKAVETLGEVTVIATDKTGTLTEGRMQLNRLEPAGLRRALLEQAVLSNPADGIEGRSADPLDEALLVAAREAALEPASLLRASPTRTEFTFDNARKRASVVRTLAGELQLYAKGAPEAILARSTSLLTDAEQRPLTDADRASITAVADRMACDGLRVVALATRRLATMPRSMDEAEAQLTFGGLAGFADPPRPEARAAVAECQSAGVRVIMITGDHPATAAAIGAEVGLDVAAHVLTGSEIDRMTDVQLGQALVDTTIVARATPEHKLRVVQALKRQGQIVAVTGDGINDAPALAAADIGVAMGARGTDVAREAADMVLTDDNFATVEHAVEEGRVLFANLRKGIRYYLACKVALVSITLLPVLLLLPVPFAPVQIILMELFMDLAASAAFVAEPAEPELMRQRPRDPKARFMDRPMLTLLFSAAAGLFAAVSLVYLVTSYSGAGVVKAQTMAFVTWILGHVLLAINLRSDREPLRRVGFFSNRAILVWAGAAIAFVLLATLLPPVRVSLKTSPLTPGDWALAAGAAIVGTFWLEARKLIRRPILSLA